MPRKTKSTKKATKKPEGAAAAVDVIAISEEFDSGDAGASKTYPIQCSALRKGGHVMLKNRPSKIVEMNTSQPGKHGHSKVHIVGMDIFSGKKYEDICPSGHTMSVPNVNREDYQVIGMSENYVNLLDNKGIVKSDVRLPEGEIGKEIKARFEADEDVVVTVMSAMDDEIICGLKKMPGK